MKMESVFPRRQPVKIHNNVKAHRAIAEGNGANGRSFTFFIDKMEAISLLSANPVDGAINSMLDPSKTAEIAGKIL